MYAMIITFVAVQAEAQRHVSKIGDSLLGAGGWAEAQVGTTQRTQGSYYVRAVQAEGQRHVSKIGSDDTA